MASNLPPNPDQRQFPLTQWSEVVRAAHPDPAVRRAALEKLLTQYCQPMRAHLVRVKRIPPDRAEDLLQGFVADKLLTLDLFGKAQQGRGRLRSLLLTALDRYVVDDLRARFAKKRGGNTAPLDEALEAVDPMSAEPDVFDQEWARQVLGEATSLMERECQRLGQPQVWLVFETRLLRPLTTGEDPISYQKLIAKAEFTSPSRVSEAISAGKALFQTCMRQVIGEYTLSSTETDEELADLQRILATLFK